MASTNSRYPIASLYPPSTDNGLGWPHAQTLVSTSHRLMFRPIAKNSCTSLKRLFVRISDL